MNLDKPGTAFSTTIVFLFYIQDSLLLFFSLVVWLG